MLSYILPPIIIVISVSALIVFLFRKAQKIPAQKIHFQSNDSLQEKKMARIMSALGQFGLKVLEKIMQRLKLTALKFHNVSNDWFHSIHERRQKNVLVDQEHRRRHGDVKIIDESVRITSQMQSQAPVTAEKVIRPLVREDVTRPQKASIREKSQLEEALIKRIAINPRDIEAYERLGDYYLESGSYQDSHECFSQVLRLSPVHRKAKIRIRRLEMLMR